VAWHQQLHEGAGVAIALLAFDDHFLDVAIVDVAIARLMRSLSP
jgi:hypothetical protein